MPDGPGGARQLHHQFGAHERVFMGRLVGQHLKGQGMKAIAGQHRRAFAISAVHGRLAAAQIIVVHAGQIVVDQRINVDAFDREADPQRPLPIDMEQPAGGDHQQRTKPLAAADAA